MGTTVSSALIELGAFTLVAVKSFGQKDILGDEGGPIKVAMM